MLLMLLWCPAVWWYRTATFGNSLVEYCCFDEADRLFELGFADQLKEILDAMPEAKQVRLYGG